MGSDLAKATSLEGLETVFKALTPHVHIIKMWSCPDEGAPIIAKGIAQFTIENNVAPPIVVGEVEFEFDKNGMLNLKSAVQYSPLGVSIYDNKS